MTTFIDTSALLAMLNGSEQNHTTARQLWQRLIMNQDALLTSSYVLSESFALIQTRIGLGAVRVLHERVVPLLLIEWVDLTLHQEGVAALFAANQRRLSLVDCVSFATMRKHGITTAFAFDQHFQDHGFVLLS